MKRKVHFIHYDGYWVAEADNGAVTQGDTLEECRQNIKDAINELENFRTTTAPPIHVEEFFDEIEVGI